MKYIFDFDDVLFHMTKMRKQNLYPALGKKGVLVKDIDSYYAVARKNHFSLKDLIAHFSLPTELYEEIMAQVPNFRNEELLSVIRELGKENCFIVSYGNHEFQLDKITRSGIGDLFQEVLIVPGSKKEAVEAISEQYEKEEVYFFDDKAHHFEDLDLVKYANLRPIHFTSTAQLRDALPGLFQHK